MSNRHIIVALIMALNGFCQTGELDPRREALDAAVREGRDRVVLNLCQAAFASSPADPEWLKAQAEAARNVGEYALAFTAGTAWMKARPRDIRSAKFIADLHLDLGDPEAALSAIEGSASRSTPAPTDSPAFSLPIFAVAGRAHVARGRDKDAEVYFDSIVEEAKRVVVRDSEDLLALAQAYVFFGGMKEAEKALIEAQKGTKLDPRPSIELGFLYARNMYLPADAVTEFQLALKVRPNACDALYGLAETLDGWMTADRHQARSAEALEQLLAINPQHVEGLLFRAQDAVTGFRIFDATRLLDQVAKVAPNHRGLITLRGVIAYLSTGESACKGVWGKLWSIDPTYGEAYRTLALVLNQRRRWPESLANAEEAARLDPSNPRIRDDVARYALFLGENEKGLAALKAADELDAFGQPWRINMRKLLSKIAKTFTTVKAGRFDVRLPAKDADLLSRVYGSFLEKSYGILRDKYGVDPDGVAPSRDRMLLEIFGSHADFSVRTLGFDGLGALGVCFGPFLAVDAPNAAPSGEIGWARVFHHELAHSMTLSLSRGRVPRWLTEGLSTYEEKCFDAAWVRPMHRELFDAWRGQDLLPIATFDSAFGTARIGYAYFQGGLVSGFLVDRYGMPKMLEFLKRLGEDVPVEAAIASVYSTTSKEIDAAFAKSIGETVGGWKLTHHPSASTVERLETKTRDGTATLSTWVDLGNRHLLAGDLPAAESKLVAARKLDATHPTVRLLDMKLAIKLGRRDRGEELMNALLSEGYEDFDLLLLAVARAERDGKGAQAIELCMKAIEAFPATSDSSSPRLTAARLLLGEGKADEAIAQLEAHLLRAPEDLKVREQVWRHAIEKKDDDRALNHLEKGLLVDPFRSQWHLEVARLRKSKSDLPGAIEAAGCASAALPQGPLRTAALVIEAEYLIASGDPSTAIIRLEKALSETPTDEKAKALRATLSNRGENPK